MTAAVRPLAAGDVAAWRRLFTAYGVFYETAFPAEVLDRVEAQLLADGSGIDALVVEDAAGEVVGFAHYRSHPDTFTGHRDWYLDDLYVDESVRGAGLATALIEALTARARASAPGGTLRWITAESNARAQRVYDRLATRTSWVTYEIRL